MAHLSIVQEDAVSHSMSSPKWEAHLVVKAETEIMGLTFEDPLTLGQSDVQNFAYRSFYFAACAGPLAVEQSNQWLCRLSSCLGKAVLVKFLEKVEKETLLWSY